MSTTEEATVNPDGSQTFENEPMNETAGEGFEEVFEEAVKEAPGIDPAFYLIGAAIIFVVVLLIYNSLRKKNDDSGDDFFASLDTEKVRCLIRSLPLV